MTAAVLSGFEATTALARLSLKRLLRGKALWFAVGLGLLPSLLALAWRASDAAVMTVWERSVTSYGLVMTIIAPILVASSLSDEIDDRTAAYLWSRAVPRWTVIAGKLLALAPVVALALAAGVTVSWALLGGPAAVPVEVFARTLLAFTAGAIGCSAVSALIATLAPRFAVPVAVAWLLLFDATIGALDVSLHVITVSFGVRAIALGTSGISGPVSLAVLTVVALAIAIRRIDRIE